MDDTIRALSGFYAQTLSTDAVRHHTCTSYHYLLVQCITVSLRVYASRLRSA